MPGIGRTGRTGRSVALLAALVLATTLIVACEPPPPATVDIYAFAGRCHVLRDETTGRYVARATTGWSAGATKAAATPFRTQATALGRYLLYGTGGQMPQAGALGGVTATTTPGPPADWKVVARSGRLGFTSLTTGRGLSVSSTGKLAQSTATEARWALVPVAACEAFPEITVNADGTPFRGEGPTARVRGFLDAHLHMSAFEFLGGRFHCGRPWSPYGITVALQDCPDHEPNGAAAAAENLLRTGNPVGTHSTDGWPSFAGWPRPDSLTHEGTYWKWVERSWRGGLRLIVNDLVENVALCEIYPLKKNPCDEMESVRLQARDMFALQDYIDAQFRGPGKGFLRIVRSPAEARRVINQGKLAVVLGVEVSEVLGCGRTGSTPHCDRAQIDQQLDSLYALGVRSLFPVHKFDNALGGTAFDNGATGLLVNLGNKWATGEWWRAEPCAPGAEADNSPTNLSGNEALLYAVFGQTIAPLLGGDLPAYPPGPLCNPKGLTALGAYVINGMIDRGMIVETDHMSVKARMQALDILEDRGYPGLISSHSWGDVPSQRRLQALGGVVAPYANVGTTYVEEWQVARAGRRPGALFGIGYGTDTNGLGKQAAPRPGPDPVRYPYVTFDGGTTMHQQKSGTMLWNVNRDGAANYGLFPDWAEDLRHLAGDQITQDLANGAEVYLRMWARARAARTG